MQRIRSVVWLAMAISVCSILCSHSTISAQPMRPPRVLLNPRSILFANPVTVGKTSSQFAIIYNFDSTREVHIMLMHPSTPEFSLMTSDSFTLAPASYDTIRVRFAPTAIGTFADSMWLYHDGDSTFLKNPTKIRISASSVSANDTTGRIQVSGGNLQFQAVVDTFQTRTFYIRNTTDDSVRRLYGTITGAHGPFSLSPAGTFDLAKGDTQQFHVRFMPTDSGIFRDTLIVQSNANAPNNSIKLLLVGSATLTAPVQLPRVSFSVQVVNFDSVTIGRDSTLPIIIRNASTSNLPITGNVTGPGLPFMLTAGAGSFTLNHGDSLVVYVRFTPSTATLAMDSVVITTNANIARARIPLLGSGREVISSSVEAEQDGSIRIYPNPATQQLHLRSGDVVKQVQLVSSEGLRYTLAVMPDERGYSIDLSGCTAGAYLLTIQTEHSTVARKLVIRH